MVLLAGASCDSTVHLLPSARQSAHKSETTLTSARTMASTAISTNSHHLLTSLIKLRRQARERRQYVYAKSLEAQERLTYERKQQLKDALASGKSLPTELRKQARELGKDLAFDEAQTGRFQPASFLLADSKRECKM